MSPRRLLPILLAGAALAAAAPAAQALPAGAVVPVGGKANCVGGRGAPCATITRGLINPVTGIFSSDGRSMYVGSLGNGGIYSFQRDTGSGKLAPIQTCLGHQLGCDGASHPMPWALAITHDDRFVYAGGANGEAGLLAYTRDATTGALTPADCLRGYKNACTYPGGNDGQSDLTDIDLTPDDRFLVAISSHGIGVVDRDPASGALSQRPGNCIVNRYEGTSYDEPSKGCVEDEKLGRPMSLGLSPDGRFAYVGAEDGGLQILSLDAAGTLARIGKAPGPDGFMEVTVAPDGRNVYAVTEDFDLLAYTRDAATGALTRIKGKTGCFGVPPCAWIKGINTPEDVRVSSDGRYVYAGGSDGIAVLKRDARGALRQAHNRSACTSMNGTDYLGIDKKRNCVKGAFQMKNMTGLEVAPGNSHLYALETEIYLGYGTGVVQPVKRR
jgi:6-phosphogluconolactonase (cycloisomerase 2 family)